MAARAALAVVDRPTCRLLLKRIDLVLLRPVEVVRIRIDAVRVQPAAQLAPIHAPTLAFKWALISPSLSPFARRL